MKRDIYARKKWRQTQILADHFWKRWLKEYIPALQERQKWHKPCRNAEVGDLVLLVDQFLTKRQLALRPSGQSISRERWTGENCGSQGKDFKLSANPYRNFGLLEEVNNRQRHASTDSE